MAIILHLMHTISAVAKLVVNLVLSHICLLVLN